jgi:F-type H+-transporting ATPase subunit epsilon
MADTDKILLSIVTPHRHVLEKEVDEVVLPGELGALGVLPEHTPLLARVGVGECEYRIGREHHYLAVSGGFAEVGPHHVTILADAVERPEEIDVERARASRKKAEEALKTATLKGVDRAMIRLKRASARLNLSRRPGGPRYDH